MHRVQLVNVTLFSRQEGFIKEFRGRFGTTPRDYADAHRLSCDLQSARERALTRSRPCKGTSYLLTDPP